MDNIRVLIVEDDPMVADINKSFTEAVKGFTVVGVARNGSEAICKVQKTNPSLVILDIFMPEVNGVEVLSHLRKQEEPIDVIMITAADDASTICKVLRCGVVAYITKPFKFDKYKAVLERYKRFRRTVEQKDTLEQEDIDGFLSDHSCTEINCLPKNFHNQTLKLIVNYLMESKKALSAEEVATGIGISRVTTRRYLEYLTNQDQIQMELDYISVGRPIHRYKIIGGADLAGSACSNAGGKIS